MELQELITKHRIAISDDVIALCNKGLKIMAEARDLSHSTEHIKRILNDLDRFLLENDEVRPAEIDFDALFLAICWHDAWRSTKISSNLLKGTFVLVWDGIGSIKLFNKHKRAYSISKKLSRRINYAIRKHAFFQILPTKSIEARLLKDLDALELFSTERVHEIEATFYENNRNDAEGFAESMEFFFNKFLKDYPEKQFYFNWSRETYKKRRRGFLKFVAEYIKSNRNAYASAIAEEAAELLSETSRTN